MFVCKQIITLTVICGLYKGVNTDYINSGHRVTHTDPVSSDGVLRLKPVVSHKYLVIISEFTNFDYKVCYVVTKVITAQSLKLEITHDGLVYYDLMYEGPRPICFQVSRVRLRGGTNGLIKSISPLTGSVPFYITGRRGWHNFFRSFVPNQEGLGNMLPFFFLSSPFRV